MAWTQNRTNLITRALKICRTVGEDQNPSTSHLQNGVDAINGAIEELHNVGLPLTQVELLSITGLSGAQVTLDLATAGDELTEDILLVYVNSGTNDDDSLIQFIRYDEYYDIRDKATTGDPVYCYVDYQTDRVLNFYPALEANTTLKILRVKKISSLDSASVSVELEKRYWDALVYKTADILSDIYVTNENLAVRIERKSNKKMKEAIGREFRSQTRNKTTGAY